MNEADVIKALQDKERYVFEMQRRQAIAQMQAMGNHGFGSLLGQQQQLANAYQPTQTPQQPEPNPVLLLLEQS